MTRDVAKVLVPCLCSKRWGADVVRTGRPRRNDIILESAPAEPPQVGTATLNGACGGELMIHLNRHASGRGKDTDAPTSDMVLELGEARDLNSQSSERLPTRVPTVQVPDRQG